LNAADVREGMVVVGSCGNCLGTVDRIEGRLIKLKTNDPQMAGQSHYVPLAWFELGVPDLSANEEGHPTNPGCQATLVRVVS
jgi:hypothetical protein